MAPQQPSGTNQAKSWITIGADRKQYSQRTKGRDQSDQSQFHRDQDQDNEQWNMDSLNVLV